MWFWHKWFGAKNAPKRKIKKRLDKPKVLESTYLRIILALLIERFGQQFIDKTQKAQVKNLLHVLTNVQNNIDANQHAPYINLNPAHASLKQVIWFINKHYHIKSISRKLYNKHYVKK